MLIFISCFLSHTSLISRYQGDNIRGSKQKNTNNNDTSDVTKITANRNDNGNNGTIAMTVGKWQQAESLNNRNRSKFWNEH